MIKQSLKQPAVAANQHRRITGKSVLPLHFHSLLVWTVWIFTWSVWATLAPAADGQDTAATPVPSWQLGISRWNGTGYDMPQAGVHSPRLTNPIESTAGNLTPYTIPIDPSAAQRPSQSIARLNPHFAPRATGLEQEPALANETSMPNAPNLTVNLAPPANPEPDQENDASSEDSIEELPAPVKPADKPIEKKPAAIKSGMAAVVDAGDAAVTEQAPLEKEVIRWYQYPKRWMNGWNSHAEFGLDGSNGNSKTLAIQTGLEMKRKTDRYTLALDVDYRQASNRGVTTEDNGRFNLDYDRLLDKSSWSTFGKFGMEWDKFKAFDLRLNVNGGLGYYWLRDDKATLVTRFGAGASQEIGAPDDDWVAEAVFGLEAERQLTSRQKLKGKVDYFPAWENFDNYRIVTDLSWEILLDGSENLSLKLAATDRYDSTPQGAKPNDVYYSMLLLYKF